MIANDKNIRDLNTLSINIRRGVIEIVQDEVPAPVIGLTPVVKGVGTNGKRYEPAPSGTFNDTTGGVPRTRLER